MDRLTSMGVFARVATTRSFSAAARELGISQATASKHVQTLEHWIGARLLNRTTRRVSLTDVGETFFAQCVRILEDMEAARLAGRPDASLRGTLRLTAPVSFGSTLLGPLFAAFMRRNPDLFLSVTLVDRPVDVVEEGYDLALQIVHGRIEDAHPVGMIVQQLMPVMFAVCAAPAYIAHAGTPETPLDLIRHVCVGDYRHPGDIWHFTGPEGEVDAPAPARLRCDNGLLRREVARAGAGIVLAPELLLEEDFIAGRLVRLLSRYQPRQAALCAVCPTSRAALPKLRSLIAFLGAGFRGGLEA